MRPSPCLTPRRQHPARQSGRDIYRNNIRMGGRRAKDAEVQGSFGRMIVDVMPAAGDQTSIVGATRALACTKLHKSIAEDTALDKRSFPARIKLRSERVDQTRIDRIVASEISERRGHLDRNSLPRTCQSSDEKRASRRIVPRHPRIPARVDLVKQPRVGTINRCAQHLAFAGAAAFEQLVDPFQDLRCLICRRRMIRL